MTAPAPFIVAADLPAYTEADALIAAVGASATIRAYARWHIGPSVTETLTLDGNGASILPLPTLHVTAVTAVTVDDSDVLADVEWTERGLLRVPGYFPTTWRSITATITHGWALADLDAVKAVAKSAATRLLSNPGQVRSQAILGYAETFTIPSTGDAMALALNRAEQYILDSYRLPATP